MRRLRGFTAKSDASKVSSAAAQCDVEIAAWRDARLVWIGSVPDDFIHGNHGISLPTTKANCVGGDALTPLVNGGGSTRSELIIG